MPARQRDFKAEYAQRKARAQAKGYTGYAQERKVKERLKANVSRAARLKQEQERARFKRAFPGHTREQFEAEGHGQIPDWYDALYTYRKPGGQFSGREAVEVNQLLDDIYDAMEEWYPDEHYALFDDFFSGPGD